MTDFIDIIVMPILLGFICGVLGSSIQKKFHLSYGTGLFLTLVFCGIGLAGLDLVNGKELWFIEIGNAILGQ